MCSKPAVCVSPTHEPKMYLVYWLGEAEALNNKLALRSLNDMNKAETLFYTGAK